MKQLAIITIFIFLFSCSNEDTAKYTPVPTPSILGKWHQKESIVNGTTFPYDDHEECGKDYFEFYGLNQIRSVDIFDCEAQTDWEGSYIVFGNDLRITSDGETIFATINVLNNTTLTFSYDYDEDVDGFAEHYVETFER